MLRARQVAQGSGRGFAARVVGPAAVPAARLGSFATTQRTSSSVPRTCSNAHPSIAFRPPHAPASAAPSSSSRPSVATSAAPAPPAPSPELFVGVDFGTSESGFAYVRPGAGAEGRVQLHTRWPDQPQGAAGPKTRTAILYELDGNGKAVAVESWGWTARQRWLSLSAEERPRYAYLENFKLLLHEGQGRGQGEGPLDTVCPLPPNLTPTQVAEDFLAEMKRYALTDLRRQGVSVHPESVRWCVTLPAMWTEADKRRVRDAAERTGMRSARTPSSLLLTLEPEAAVLAVAFGRQQQLASAAAGEEVPGSEANLELHGAKGSSAGAADTPSRARKGAVSAEDVVLVLDCGGGTVDLTLARVYGTGRRTRLEEEAVGRGVLAGSRFVDAEAFALLRTLVGEEPWDEWRRRQPDEWVQLEERWEAAKRTFKGSHGEEVQLVLPQGLAKTFKQGKPQSLPVIDDPSGDGSSYLFRVDTAATPERLLLPAPALEALVFKPVVDQIMREAREMLQDALRTNTAVDKVLLVGGFSTSPYLQQRVKEDLGGVLAADPRPTHTEAAAAALMGESAKLLFTIKTRVLIPAQPAAAVVVGAVRFGQQPECFTARRCRLSYGISMYMPWNENHEAHHISYGYPEKVRKGDDGTFRAANVFRQYVQRGQRVQVDEVVTYNFSPIDKSEVDVTFPLYATKSEVGRYTCEPGMRQVATVTLDLPPGWSQGLSSAAAYRLQADMQFGATELTVVARDLQSGNAVATSVEWDGELEG